jgi:hypothetical protein
MLDFIKRIRFYWNYRHLPHPASREFLQTYEWARVRYQVLLKYRDGRTWRAAAGRSRACG